MVRALGRPSHRLPELSVSDSISGRGEKKECKKVHGDTPVNSGMFSLVPCEPKWLLFPLTTMICLVPGCSCSPDFQVPVAQPVL